MLRPHHRRNGLSNVLLPYTTSPTTSSPSPSRSGSISSTSSQPSRLHLRRGAVIYQHAPISHVVNTYRRGSDERRSSIVASVLDHVQPYEKVDTDTNIIKSNTDVPPTSTSTSTSSTNMIKPDAPPEITRIPSLSFSSSMNTVSTSSIISHPSHASSASMSMSMSTSSSIHDPNSVSHEISTIIHDIPITRERANTTPITMSASVTPAVDVDMTRTRSHTVMDWSTPFLSVNPMYNSWSHIDHIMIVEDATPPSLASHSLQERKYVVSHDDSDTSSTSSSDSDGFHIRRHSISSTISGPRLIQRRNAIVLDRYALINALNQSTPTVSAVRNSPHSLSTIYSDTADVKHDDHDSMSMVSTPSSISHME